jgi:hypothetical protein
MCLFGPDLFPQRRERHNVRFEDYREEIWGGITLNIIIIIISVNITYLLYSQ